MKNDRGRPYTMTLAKLRRARAAMGQPETHVGALCAELGITRQTLYRHVGPKGELRPDGEKRLAAWRRAGSARPVRSDPGAVEF